MNKHPLSAAVIVALSVTASQAATLDGSASISEFSIRTFFGDPIVPSIVQNVSSFSESDTTPIADYSINANIENGSLSHSLLARNIGNPDTQFGDNQFVDISYDYYDFLTFSDSAEVTFQLSFDGTHSVDGTDGSIGSGTQFRLFDITDLTGNAVTLGDSGLSFSDEITEENLIASNGISGGAFVEEPFADGGNPTFDINLPFVELDGSGETTSFDETVIETAAVEAGRSYLAVYGIVSITALRNEETFSTADFLNTSTLGIIDFGGTTVTSASGQFLTNSSVTVSPVPLPAGLPLLMAGLFGLGAMKRRAKND